MKYYQKFGISGFVFDITKTKSCLLIVLLFASSMVFSQNNTTKEPPFLLGLKHIEVELLGNRISEVDSLSYCKGSGTHKFTDGDFFKIILEPNPDFQFVDETYYFQIFDLSPDNELKLLYPDIHNPRPHEEFRLYNRKNELEPLFIFQPPYGYEKIIAVFNTDPYIFDEFHREVLINKTDKENTSLILQDLQWLLKGEPPMELQSCFVSTISIYLSQEEMSWNDPGENDKSKPETSETNVEEDNHALRDQNINQELNCLVDIDASLLYHKYPIITLTNPLLMGDDMRGIESLSYNTSFKKFIISGTVNVINGVSEVYVNDQKAFLKNRTFWEKEITLYPGENDVRITANSNDGESITKCLTLNYEETEYEKHDKNNYLVLIGINDYRHWPKLKNPINDAKSLSNVLTDQYQFDKENTYCLFDDSATYRNIDNFFRMLIRKIDEDDNLVVYFAGHGYYDEITDEGYWIPYEANLNSLIEYIPNSTIYKYLKALKAHHTLVIADACFSGTFYTSDQRGADRYTETVDKYRSKWVFTSGREETVADGMYGTDHSPFANYLIKFFKNAGNADFPVTELVQYVKHAVANNSNQTPMAAPLKEVGDEGGEFVFYRKDKEK